MTYSNSNVTDEEFEAFRTMASRTIARAEERRKIEAILRAADQHSRSKRVDSLHSSGVIAVDGNLVAACGCMMSALTLRTRCDH